jgi:hypothetical protein
MFWLYDKAKMIWPKFFVLQQLLCEFRLYAAVENIVITALYVSVWLCAWLLESICILTGISVHNCASFNSIQPSGFRILLRPVCR